MKGGCVATASAMEGGAMRSGGHGAGVGCAM